MQHGITSGALFAAGPSRPFAGTHACSCSMLMKHVLGIQPPPCEGLSKLAKHPSRFWNMNGFGEHDWLCWLSSSATSLSVSAFVQYRACTNRRAAC